MTHWGIFALLIIGALFVLASVIRDLWPPEDDE